MPTYSLLNFTKEESIFIDQVLHHKKAWPVNFRHVLSSPSIFVVKLPKENINKIFWNYPYLHNLSVCDRTSNPIKIYICKENWNSIPQASGYKDLNLYRTYLILHEFGHALGLDHAECVEGPAPVMMQQTKGCGKCYPDPWAIK